MKYRSYLAAALFASLLFVLTASNLRAFDVVNLWPTTPPGDDAARGIRQESSSGVLKIKRRARAFSFVAAVATTASRTKSKESCRAISS